MTDITLDPIDGFSLAVTIQTDDTAGAPWENSDGHGPVTPWLTRPKLAGEIIISDDGQSHYRYYNWQEACRIARRDQWGVTPYSCTIEASARNPGMYQATAHFFDANNILDVIKSDWCDCPNEARAQIYSLHRATMTARQYAALAVKQDFDRLKAWCDDQWHYIGVIVTASKAGVKLGESSLWGIESDDSEHIKETATELAQEAIHNARATIAALTE